MIYTWRCCEVFCGGKKERKYKRAEITLKNGSLSGGKEDEKNEKARISHANVFVFTLTFILAGI
jgi:hypothetical protein